MLFKYCGIIGLLVNIPITICITVIPPPLLPSPPSLSPLPSLSPPPSLSPHVPSPPSLPTLPPSPPHPLFPILHSPPFPPSNKFIFLSSLSKALVIITMDPGLLWKFYLDLGRNYLSTRRAKQIFADEGQQTENVFHLYITTKRPWPDGVVHGSEVC